MIALAELGGLSDIVIVNLAARYHDPVAVGIGSTLALWSVAALAIAGGRGPPRILPLRWIARARYPARPAPSRRPSAAG